MTPEEPPNHAFVRTGQTWPYTFWERDDQATREYDTDMAETDRHWWDCSYEDGGEEGPVTWEYLLTQPMPLSVHLRTLCGWNDSTCGDCQKVDTTGATCNMPGCVRCHP